MKFRDILAYCLPGTIVAIPTILIISRLSVIAEALKNACVFP